MSALDVGFIVTLGFSSPRGRAHLKGLPRIEGPPGPSCRDVCSLGAWASVTVTACVLYHSSMTRTL